MAGINGATRDTVGGLEGINIRLSRQLQLLQQELQQRQINFSVAIAGFQAPGLTSEERAARIAQAKLEAEYAQKQLDLQKQIASNQFKGINISASRSVTDLVAQIRLLEQGRELTIHTASAQRALEILNRKQQQLVEKAGTYIEEGMKIVSAANQAAFQVQVQTGKAFNYVLSETAKAWGIFGDQARIVLQSLMGTAPPGTKPSSPNHGAASGLIGDTLGQTDITVGEAGREKVAILKNPRIISASQLAPSGGVPGGGGGGVNLTVIVTGNTIRDNSDIDQLVTKVARKVEDLLNTRGSLVGLRNLTS
jgi:hypothetical protein